MEHRNLPVTKRCTWPTQAIDSRFSLWLVILLASATGWETVAQEKSTVKNIEVPFKSHDGHEMLGKLVLPSSGEALAVVIYVQTAEGATVDMKRHKSAEETFNYYDLYREKLTTMNVAFFSYEGRGIRMGNKPPRFERVDWDIYNTSTLENKVKDVLSAMEVVRKQPGLGSTRIFLMGASEGTLLAAEAAAREPKQVAGLVLYGLLASNMRENFRYIMTDGAFLQFRHKLDTDDDGKVSKQELEAPSKSNGENKASQGAPFEKLDVNGDGFFAVDDLIVLGTKPYVDAIEKEDFAVLQEWSRTSAAVVVPKDWFKDHFAHAPIWTFLSQLDIPVGCFHGALDTNAPIAAVRKLEEQAKAAGKTKMQFFYFEDLEHTLGIIDYFIKGTVPAGHHAIFEFIKDQAQAG